MSDQTNGKKQVAIRLGQLALELENACESTPWEITANRNLVQRMTDAAEHLRILRAKLLQ